MSKPVSRGTPFARPPRPTTVWRSTRSSMSTQRRQVIECGSSPRSFPCRRCESTIAASRLFAAPIAWMSPVKWRLISSIGTTWARPPPVPPPFRPKTGPERRLPQAEQRLLADRAEPLGQRDRGGRLALAEPGRRHRRDRHDPAVGPAGQPVDRRELDLRGRRAVREHLVGLEPQRMGQLGDHRRIL